jgi:hypothetical protein
VTGDEALGPNPVTLLFRHVFRQRMQTLFAGRARVAEVGGLDVRSARDLDGAFAGPGVLEGADLATLGRALAVALRPGAPVLLCVGARRRERTDIGEARARLGPGFVWHGAFALGVIVPGELAEEWVRGHPQAFGVLAAVEGLVRRWPVLRARGEYVVIEGARRQGAGDTV